MSSEITIRYTMDPNRSVDDGWFGWEENMVSFYDWPKDWEVTEYDPWYRADSYDLVFRGPITGLDQMCQILQDSFDDHVSERVIESYVLDVKR